MPKIRDSIAQEQHDLCKNPQVPNPIMLENKKGEEEKNHKLNGPIALQTEWKEITGLIVITVAFLLKYFHADTFYSILNTK